MTYARKTLISLQDTPYYHLVGRCVRRAWLWGVDTYSGRDYSHRKQWVLARLNQLTSMTAINVCAYAIMSNHYHIVIHVDPARAKGWTREEVVARWSSMFQVPTIIDRWLSGEAGEAEREIAEAVVETWRERLYSVSWFMKCLNEHLARKANTEDNCTGHFWEGRFRSQALLDDPALVTAMVYVDLNPIRAGVTASPEESEFTSLYQRLREAQAPLPSASDTPCSTVNLKFAERIPLVPFKGSDSVAEVAIPFRFDQYLELIEWTSRSVYAHKSAAIEGQAPPLIKCLNIEADAWRHIMRSRGNVFGRAIGRLERLRLHATTLGQFWIRGLRTAQRLYLR